MRNSFGREADSAPQAGFESVEGGILAEKSLQFLMHLLAILLRQVFERLNEHNHRHDRRNQKKQKKFQRLFS